MQRSDKMLISKQPYAVAPNTFEVNERYSTYDSGKRLSESPSYWISVEAVWFKRKSGLLAAHFGNLWDVKREAPADVTSWLEGMTDGRYGGRCVARWNGNDLWAPEVEWDHQVELQKLLADMLAGYPAAPAGYEGWWTFK